MARFPGRSTRSWSRFAPGTAELSAEAEVAGHPADLVGLVGEDEADAGAAASGSAGATDSMHIGVACERAHDGFGDPKIRKRSDLWAPSERPGEIQRPLGAERRAEETEPLGVANGPHPTRQR
jgi:hypothetical protein